MHGTKGFGGSMEPPQAPQPPGVPVDVPVMPPGASSSDDNIDAWYYNVRISNPSGTEDLRVSEMFLSRPDLYTIEYVDNDKSQQEVAISSENKHQQVELMTPFSAVPEFIDDGPVGEGPVVIPPGAAGVHFATVRLVPQVQQLEQEDFGSSFSYLYLRTNMGDLTVTLHASLTEEACFGGASKELNKTYETTNLNNNSANTGPKIDRTDSTSKINPDEPAIEPSIFSHPSEILFEILTTDYYITKLSLDIHNPTLDELRIMRITVGLDATTYYNYTTDDKTRQQSNHFLGFNVDVLINENENPGDSPRRRMEEGDIVLLPPNETLTDAIVLECIFKNPEDFPLDALENIKFPIQFTGSVIIRATADRDVTFEDWQDNMKNYPYRELDLVLEVPVKASIMPGGIGVEGDKDDYDKDDPWQKQPWIGSHGLYFYDRGPCIRNQRAMAKPSSTSLYEDSGRLNHIIKLVNEFILPLQVNEVYILDANETMVQNDDKSSSQASCCAQLSVTERKKYPPTLGNDYLGAVTITRESPSFWDGESFTPCHCYMAVTTKPVQTRVHMFPIHIMPGVLKTSFTEESVSPFVGGANVKLQNDSEQIPGGSESFRKWIQSTDEGEALETMLKRFASNLNMNLDTKCRGSACESTAKRRHSMGDSTQRGSTKSHDDALIQNYLRILSSPFSSEIEESCTKPVIDPLLLHMGAIGHGEVKMTHIYITNHNLLPIKLHLGNSKLEGMTAEMGTGRVRSVGGHAESIPDLIPAFESTHPAPERKGRYGHPLPALRDFLIKNPVSTNFFNSFTVRDKIELSSEALKKQPILSEVYKMNAYARFYREHVPSERHQAFAEKYEHLMDGIWSESPAAYQSNATEHGMWHESSGSRKSKQTSRKGLHPMLFSADLSLVHPLPAPPELGIQSTSESMKSQTTTITVPPAGQVRVDIQVRAPPKHVLPNDVTSFVATGLVLYTDTGHIMPVITTYEALLGQLKGTVEEKRKKGRDKADIVDIPLVRYPPSEVYSNQTYTYEDYLGLFGLVRMEEDSDEEYVEKEEYFDEDAGIIYILDKNLQEPSIPEIPKGVPLFISSTFSHELILQEVISCNTWFHVDLLTPNDGHTSGDVAKTLSHSQGNTTEASDDISASDGKKSNLIGITIPSFVNDTVSLETPVPVRIGDIRSDLDCFSHQPSELGNNSGWSRSTADSIYSCALDWLERPTSVQPLGCGIPVQSNNSKEEIENATHRAVNAMRDVQEYMTATYGERTIKHLTGESGRTYYAFAGIDRSDDDVRIPFDILALFDEVRASWAEISRMGLNIFTSTLKADAEYYSGPVDDKAELSALNSEAHRKKVRVALSDIVLRSALELPRLFDCAIDMYGYPEDVSEAMINEDADSFVDGARVIPFRPTPMGKTHAVSVHIRNPTSVPIIVRLTAADVSNRPLTGEDGEELDPDDDDRIYDGIYIQSEEGDDDPWWSGVGHFVSDSIGNLLQSTERFTSSTEKSALTQGFIPSLQSISAFILGCGKRCGIKDENLEEDTTEKMMLQMREKSFSVIGASAAENEELIGYPSDIYFKTHREYLRSLPTAEAYERDLDIPGLNAPLPAPFALSLSALEEYLVEPYSNITLGPIYFRPTAHTFEGGFDGVVRQFQTEIFLENSLTGFERLVLRGEGLIEKVAFLDSGLADSTGDLESRYGQSALMFSGSGSEYSYDSPYSWLSFLDVAPSQPELKSVIVHNDGDVAVDFSDVYLSDPDAKSMSNLEAVSSCEHRGFQILGCDDSDSPESVSNGFRLLGGESRTLWFEYTPDCSVRTNYVMLNLQHRYREPGWECDDETFSQARVTNSTIGLVSDFGEECLLKSKEQLLLGFDMTAEEVKKCVP
eukprot:scaffold48735_cov59-Attheya_sp.AAC.1